MTRVVARGTHRAVAAWCAVALIATVLGPARHAGGAQEEVVVPPPSEVQPQKPATANPSSALAAGAPVTTPQDSRPSAPPQMEVVGFMLQGSAIWQRLRIDDLDMIVTPAGVRMLPLQRLLRAFHVEVTEQAEVMTFQPEGMPPRIFDLRARTIRLNGHDAPVEFIRAVSDVTNQPDLFLPAEVTAEIFGIPLEWNEDRYEFQAKTSRNYKFWKLKMTSMAEILREDEEAKLPQRHPTAMPWPNSLDFMQIEGYAQVRGYHQGRTLDQAQIQSMRQTFWGRALDGAYKVALSEPSLLYDRVQGASFDDRDPIGIDWIDWTFRRPNMEISLGDSSFGVTDLIFPYMQMTGVRVNGLLGNVPKGADTPEISPGLRQTAIQPYDLEGSARAGSKAQLLINDRVVDERDVVGDSPNQPGMGTYRFEDVRLSSGVLNDVRIVVTDPDGVKTSIRRDILPTTQLLPQGQMTYLAAVGTSRDSAKARCIGDIATARALYGLTDRLTVGAAVVTHENFFWQNITDSQDTLSLEERTYPRRGEHAGGQFAWKPLDYIVVTGSAAVSQLDTGADTAGVLRADVYPVRDVTCSLQGFRYGPNYFNGQSLDLCDRQGWAASAAWQPNTQWRLRTTVGSIRDNLDGHLAQTDVVDFQHFDVETNLVPRTTFSFAYDRALKQWAGQSQSLMSLRGRSVLPWDITLYGEVAVGENVAPRDNPTFFSGLAVPGLGLYSYPIVSETLVKPIGMSHSVGQTFTQVGDRTRATAYHTYRSPGTTPIQIRTEVGMDFYTGNSAGTYGSRTPYFENRTEYLMDVIGRNRVGLLTHCEHQEWQALLYVAISDRFAFVDDRPVRIRDERIMPDRGAIRGKVYVDCNADAELSVGEQGLEGIKVVVNRSIMALTDSAGCFILPSVRAATEVRVSLDMSTVPATYKPTHGTQTLVLLPNSATEVNLGVAPASTFSGVLRIREAGGEVKPLTAVRVYAVERQKGEVVNDSITAGDGSFCLSDLIPGRYVIHVDLKTLPATCGLADPAVDLEIPCGPEPQDLNMEPLVAVRKPSEPPAPSPPPAPDASTAPASPGAKANPEGR